MKMDLEEIAYELELAGVNMAEQRMLLSAIKKFGFDAKEMDKKLKALGYAAIFTIYDDDYKEEWDHQTQS